MLLLLLFDYYHCQYGHGNHGVTTNSYNSSVCATQVFELLLLPCTHCCTGTEPWPPNWPQGLGQAAKLHRTVGPDELRASVNEASSSLAQARALADTLGGALDRFLVSTHLLPRDMNTLPTR